MLYTWVPIVAAVFGAILLGEPVRIRKLAYMALGLAGALFVLVSPLIDAESKHSGGLEGNVLICVGVLCWALYLVASKPLHRHYTPLLLTAVFVILSSAAFFPLAVLDLYSHPGWWIHVSEPGVLSLLYLTAFGTLGNYLLVQYAVRNGGPSIASLSLYLIPVFAFVTAHILLGESPSIALILGTAIVLLSVAAITYTD
jgi:drug/metabolite transporter (DMT)-like permease